MKLAVASEVPAGGAVSTLAKHFSDAIGDVIGGVFAGSQVQMGAQLEPLVVAFWGP